MKKELLLIVLLAAFAVSCKKSSNQAIAPVTTNSTASIKAPTGFTWENSRNVNFTITITDTRFQNMIYMVAIYDGDPAAGGNLVVKGAATLIRAFESKLYISNQITQVYIVKTAPDNSTVTLKQAVTATVVAASMGQ